ncbi:hypothetical protein Rumeso_04400 [Rubellimicrobium mesophilum DSM 19309]|uniref:HTH cro/C1-type domain-containing protein n=1 Tax=Rubellimicrobium mesophilum DSM 19309 TaxID=442562 RepID=A0A017HJU4_9RHOB|nr:hypothetical protein [Rubellimicrobium mesophilum]EYD74029.1 hypothetical protein Rumeso_04400 [Rubellimicrobium mesophilum DSM 19309]
MTNWFERLTGFRETGYAATRARLRVEDGLLHSDASDRRAAVGRLELVSLAELRERAQGVVVSGRLRLGIVQGDVRGMHLEARNEGALFQVASQFNLLEMVSPEVTPEEGVARYEWDRTQGPACAIAAGAGTIFRNYFAPVDDQEGQTALRQLDGLRDLGETLAARLGVAPGTLWQMENGYAFPTGRSLSMISAHLKKQSEADLDGLRGLLRVGLQSDVEVTDGDRIPGPLVSQIYCSALPVGYSELDRRSWTEFACLVQEAAYETTLLAAVLNAARGASRRVLLTRIGGGVFGNDDRWISAAILRALRLVKAHDLEVDMVSYGVPSKDMRELLATWQAEAHQDA